MGAFTLDARTRMSIELAMTAHAADAATHERQEAQARSLGLSGAEIDAARRGRSFDAWTSLAVTLAVASRQPRQPRHEQMRRALDAGLSEQLCRDIETLAGSFGN